MALKKISPSVHQLSIGTSVNLFFIDHGGGLTVVDTGTPGSIDGILRAILALGKQPTEVSDILITHYHPDHIGSLTELTEATGARVHVPAGEGELIRNGGDIPTMTGRGVTGALLMKMIKPMRIDPHEVHSEVSDGDVLGVAGGIRCISTPGHTGGHVCFLWDTERVLFVGDAVFNLLQLTAAPIAEDHDLAAESFRKLAQLDFDIAVFGHGRPIKSGAAARFQKAAS